MVKRIYLGLLLTILFGSTLRGQNHTPIGFSFWDVGYFYDTIPSNFYDDSRFTPKGRYRWSGERYWRKVANIAAVIDSLHMPIIALSGVETEDVVRDIVVACKGDYSYIHRTLNTRDGLDFALLYYGDIFMVDRVHSDYATTYIEGEMYTKRVGIWLTKSGYFLKSASPPHRDSVDMVVVAGGFYKDDLPRMGLVDYMAALERRGYGTAKSRTGWYMRHRIALADSVSTTHEGIFLNKWLLNSDRTEPKATYDNSWRAYIGGYSRYLPIYIYFWVD